MEETLWRSQQLLQCMRRKTLFNKHSVIILTDFCNDVQSVISSYSQEMGTTK